MKYCHHSIKFFFCSFLSMILVTAMSLQMINAQTYNKVDPGPFADSSNHWYFGFDKSNIINPMPGTPKYKPTDIKNIADNILLFQKLNGGWPKSYDMFAILTDSQKDRVLATKYVLNTTYDNGSTFIQVTVLANVYKVTKDEKYKMAALKGFDYILISQYRNGGWPQYYPLEENDSKQIT